MLQALWKWLCSPSYRKQLAYRRKRVAWGKRLERDRGLKSQGAKKGRGRAYSDI